MPPGTIISNSVSNSDQLSRVLRYVQRGLAGEGFVVIVKDVIKRGSVVLNMAVIFSPVAIVLSHSGNSKMRLTKLMSFPCNIFACVEMIAD